jgi:hypothetical protein
MDTPDNRETRRRIVQGNADRRFLLATIWAAFEYGVPTMRLLLWTTILAACATLGANVAMAQTAKSYPYCATTSGIGTECTFDNLAQCQQDVEGVGGWCDLSKAYQGRSGAFGTMGSRQNPQPPNQ